MIRAHAPSRRLQAILLAAIGACVFVSAACTAVLGISDPIDEGAGCTRIVFGDPRKNTIEVVPRSTIER